MSFPGVANDLVRDDRQTVSILRSLLITFIGEPAIADAADFARLLSERHCAGFLSIGKTDGRPTWSDRDCGDHLGSLLADERYSDIVALPGHYGTLGCLPYLGDPLRTSPCEISSYGDGCMALLKLAKYDLLKPTYVSNIKDNLNALGDFIAGGTSFGSSFVGLSSGKTLRPGRASGRVVAGRLGAIASLIGTPDDPFDEPTILYVEEWGSTAERVDRDLQHIKMRTALAALAVGPLLGPDTDVDEASVVEEVVLAFGVPTLSFPNDQPLGWPVGRSFDVTF